MSSRVAGRLASLLILAGLAGPGASAAQAGTLDLGLAGTTITELAPADGVLGAGDQFRVTVSVTSHEAGTLSDLQGDLSSQSPSFASVVTRASAFTSVAQGDTTTNTTAFQVALTNSPAWCGQPVRLNLHLARGSVVATVSPRSAVGDSVDLPFTVRTGLPGSFVSRDAVLGSGMALAAGATTTSTLTVPASGELVRDLRVRIGDLRHARLADLRLTLVSPGGKRVGLLEGAPGTQLRDTVLAAGGASPSSAAAPLTGTFAPQGDLSALDGEPVAGNWRLEVQDTGTGTSTGSLLAWGLDLAPATCAARPVASFLATPSPVPVGSSATLDATSSRIPNGTISTYEWDFGDGTWISSPGPTTTHLFPTRGAIPVKLRITGQQGETDTVTQTVPVGQAPVAAVAASPPTVTTGEATTLDAAGSTSPGGGSIRRYEWDLDGNGTFEVDGGSTPRQDAAFADIGTHVATVRVTNDIGATATAPVTINVTNRRPTARLSVPSPVLAGGVVAVDASGSTDPDDGIVQYRFDLDGDGIFEVDGTSPVVQHAFAAGPHTATVTVTDRSGASSSASVTFTATQPPQAVLVATPDSVRPGRPVTLDASGSSDPDGTIARYDFDLDGDGTYETPAAPGATSVTRSWPTRGVKAVGVRVTDSDGATATASGSVSVVNLSPLPVLTAGPGPVQVGQVVVLDGAGSSDPDGRVVRYEWDLDGNGSFETDTGAIPTAARSYANALSLRVGLRVTDDDGQTASTSIGLVIVAAPATSGPSAPPGGGGTFGVGGPGPGVGLGSGLLGASGPGAPSGTGAAGGTGSPAGAGGAPAGAGFTAALQATAVQKLRDVARKGLAFTCQADRTAACVVTVTLGPADARAVGLLKVARGRKAQPLILATLKAGAEPGRDGQLVLRLSGRLKKAFGRRPSVLVVLTGTATDAAGHAVALSRAVMVKR